jgi:transcriptional regulator with XRE-family HTH domain
MSSSFGEALRAARERRELFQELLVDSAGLNQTVISLYERGETTRGLDAVGLLSRGLGVSLSEVVERDVPAGARSRQGHDDGSGGR